MSEANRVGSSQGADILAKFMKAMREGAGGGSGTNIDQGIKLIEDAVAGQGDQGASQQMAAAPAQDSTDRGGVVV